MTIFGPALSRNGKKGAKNRQKWGSPGVRGSGWRVFRPVQRAKNIKPSKRRTPRKTLPFPRGNTVSRYSKSDILKRGHFGGPGPQNTPFYNIRLILGVGGKIRENLAPDFGGFWAPAFPERENGGQKSPKIGVPGGPGVGDPSPRAFVSLGTERDKC